MAVGFDNSVNVTGANQPSLTSADFTVGSGANRAVFVFVINDGGVSVTAVSCAGLSVAGATLALVGTAVNNSGRIVRIYVGVAPSSGLQAASATWANTDAARQAICAVTFDGVDQTTPAADYTTDATGATGGAAPAITVPNVTSLDFVVDALFHQGITAQGADQTARLNDGTASAGASTQPGTAGGDMSWTTGESLIYSYAACRVVAAAAAERFFLLVHP